MSDLEPGVRVDGPASDDDRGITVTIADAGRDRLAQVFPGHIELVKPLFLEPLSRDDVRALAGPPEPVRDHMRSLPPRSAAPRRRRGSA